MNKIKLSVIIPVFNGEEFIEKGIDSVLKSPLVEKELIVVDDGSTDETPEILKKYKETKELEGTFITLHQENKGVYSAINAGLEIAKGEFVMFLGADDFIHPAYLQMMLGFTERNPDYHVYYPELIHHAFAGKEHKLIPAHTRDFSDELKNNLVPSMFAKRGTEGFPHGCTLYKLSMFKELGFYDDTWECRQDTFYIIKNIDKIQIKRVPRTTGCYSIRHGNNISKDLSKRGKNIARGMLFLLENFDWQRLCPSCRDEKEFIARTGDLMRQASQDGKYLDPKDLTFESAFKEYINKHYRNYKNVAINTGAPLKVALLSYYDYAGAANQIIQAVKRVSNIDITFIRGGDTQYKHNETNGVTAHPKNKEFIQKVLKEADVIHFKGDEPPDLAAFLFQQKIDALLNITKPTIITLEGSKFRRTCRIPECAHAKWPFSSYREQADIITCISPDLNYPELGAKFLQHPFDTVKYDNLWEYNKNRIVISHSPSNRRKKATNGIFIPAVFNLQQYNKRIEVQIMENMDNEDVIQQKKYSTLFFDQCAIGWYGIAAIEAAVWGIPIICWISEEAVQQAGNALLKEMPIISFAISSDGLQQVLHELVNETEENLQMLSNNTRKWFHEFHSFETVGKLWKETYESLF